MGLVLALSGLALLIALASYDSHDPSLNTASSRETRNLAGPLGALVSDLLLQSFGFAAMLPGLTLLVWAWRLGSRRGMGSVAIRLAALLAAIPAAAAALASLSGQGMVPWPTLAGPGGASGWLLADMTLALGVRFAGPVGAMLIWTAGVALAILLTILALGLTVAEWRSAGKMIRTAAHAMARVWRWMRFAQPLSTEGLSTEVLPKRTSSTRAARAARVPGSSRLLSRLSWLSRMPGFLRMPAFRPMVFRDRPPPPVAGGLDIPPPPNAVWDQEPEIHQDHKPAARETVAETQAPSRYTPPPPRPAIQPPPRPKTMPAHEPKPASEEAGWRFPPITLLHPPPPQATVGPSQEALEGNARLLIKVLGDYGVKGIIVDIKPGPVVTMYELEPEPGIRSARVIGLADDVARSLSVTAVRIATVPGRNVIGIEVPNAKRDTVYLSEILSSDEVRKHAGRLPLALGKNIAGQAVVTDLTRMPHLMIAGTTGSGKSVGVNAMILSLLYRLSPDQCRLILIDPKMLELSIYDGIPHLMAPVVTEPAKAVTALKWVVREMERRYRNMSQLSVRNIGGYNERVEDARRKGEIVTRRVQTGFDSETGKPTFEEQPLALEPLPFIVVVVDEMADLMMVAGKEIETAVQRLAQMARAAGIHVIMATQRPSVDVITGTIKANFPTRISFQVISKFDSRTILGEQGAEQLLGMGDMLFMQGGGRITRVHGPFVSDEEVERVVGFLREQGEPVYLDEVTEPVDKDDEPAMSGIAGASDGEKGLFDQAVDVVAREGKASTSFIQRHLNIGYNRAAKLIEQMEKEGIVGAANHVGKREVLVRRTADDDD